MFGEKKTKRTTMNKKGICIELNPPSDISVHAILEAMKILGGSFFWVECASQTLPDAFAHLHGIEKTTGEFIYVRLNCEYGVDEWSLHRFVFDGNDSSFVYEKYVHSEGA